MSPQRSVLGFGVLGEEGDDEGLEVSLPSDSCYSACT